MSLAQHRLLKATDSAFGEALGISTAQLGVLFALESNPGGMPRDIAAILGINKSAMTSLMDRMEASGLLRREFSDEDGRALRLFASPGGLAKAVAARPMLARLNARLTSGFDGHELGTIARFLSSILERF
jgi:DNA-binding MarR family transcriptional regulator